MAHIQRRGPGRYRVRYLTPDGKERSRTFARKADAEAFLVSVSHEVRSGTYLDPARGRVTFREYTERLLAERSMRPASERLRRAQLKWLYPTFGDRRIGTIRAADIRAWQRDQLGRLRPVTVRNAQGFLSLILRHAVTDRVIPENPCAAVPLPVVPRPILMPPTADQVQRLAEAIGPRYVIIVVLGAGTGMRISEILGLTWDHVDLSRGFVRVDRQLAGIADDGSPIFGWPKTGASIREIPLSDSTVADLRAYRERHPSDGLVVRTETGSPVNLRSFHHIWRPAADTAGIKGGSHQLRHFYVSVLIDAGLSVKEVQRRVGHASGITTLDVYAHLWPDNEDRTRRAVDSALGRLQAVEGRERPSVTDQSPP